MEKKGKRKKRRYELKSPGSAIECPVCGEVFMLREVRYETDNPYDSSRMIGPYGVPYETRYYTTCPNCDAEFQI